MVEGLRVYCRHRPRGGCQWVGELGEVEKHLNGTEGCLYACRMVEGLRVYCRHRPRGGCQWVGELGEVEKHLNGTEGCLYVRVACQQCKKMFLKCNLQLHISKTCPMTPVACEVEEYCCNVKIPRRAMARHMEHNHAVHLKMDTKIFKQ